VSLFGNVQITTQALRAVLERGVSVSLLSTGGWFYGRATGVESKNVELRIAQHRAMVETDTCLTLARGIVASKIRNSRTLLRRNHVDPPEVTLFELEQLAKKAEKAESIASLLGIEGTAARSYFGSFAGMMKGQGAESFDLEGRNRRPPRDPVNALLSLAYALLTKDFAQVIASAGLDPLLGFYHQPRFGRPALALDLMEEFRPIVADSTVISAINNGAIVAVDFITHPTGVALKPNGRRAFILAYERRMDQLVTHPVFGYRVSYRRVLEVQARLFGRFLMGEIPSYPEFRTR
jgi:CRISPR-associated protein Cas1